LTAQVRGNPSVSLRATSEGISRIVDVIGAMVTSPRNPMADCRLRMRTGRFLPGAESDTTESRPGASVGPGLFGAPPIELAAANRLPTIPVAVTSLELLNAQSLDGRRQRTACEGRPGKTQPTRDAIDFGDELWFQRHLDGFHGHPHSDVDDASYRNR